MNIPRPIHALATAFLVSSALTLSLTAHAGKGDKPPKPGGGLNLINSLLSESGVTQGIAEGNELLTFSIIVSNPSKKAKVTDVIEVVPEGTSYAGGDDFASACRTGAAAGARCAIKVSVPGKSRVNLRFNINVDDPVTTFFINNEVTASAVDCSTNDCSELMYTAGIGTSSGFRIVSGADWTETSVRKVLHAFAYGGLTSDAQIAAWAAMSPAVAIEQMLDFSYTNELLSPRQDATSDHADSLASLQRFWGDPNDVTNPMRWDKQRLYPTLTTAADGTTTNFNRGNMQRTWIQAVNARGVNPFLHKVAFFLTNYQLSIKANLAGNGLFRSYYDQVLADLVNRQPFTTLIANAAKSAATARRYRHQYNRYNNSTMRFYGNDDFAREFFQLYFRYNGMNEDIEYHEGVNIENNAKLLTGMNIDYESNAYGSNNTNDWYVAPINFYNHTDLNGRVLNNLSNHHADCLEIFHQMVCGATAEEKIHATAAIVALDPEVMRELPAYVISYFADDGLTDAKVAKIAAAWAKANDDLLGFLRNYAISDTFHSEDTVKYRSTFNRNLTLYNTVVLDNEEAFIGRQNYDLPLGDMLNQGGEVFMPAHDVFGGQTGTEASGNPNIFKVAYDAAALNTTSRLSRTALNYYTDATQTVQATWDKDWGAVIPANGAGQYVVADVAQWLWRRIVGDGGKNFDSIARSQIYALLARGQDFGYAVTVMNPSISTDPLATYPSLELDTDPALLAVINTLGAQTIALENANITSTRRTANYRVNWAVNFIAMLPYTFALEGK